MRTVSSVTLLAVLALVSGCTSGGSADPLAPTSATSATSARVAALVIPRPATAGHNRSLAVAAAARANKDFPVPPGSRRIDAAPAGAPHLQRLGAIMYPVDGSLTRTRWWLVPRGYQQVVDWYVAHTPANRATTLDRPHAKRSDPDAQVYWPTHVRSTAYSAPAEVVGYTRLGPHLTAIRTDVTLAARADRTAQTLVPATVTSLQVTKRAIDEADTSPRTVTVRDPSLISAVVAAYDQVPGAYISDEFVGCGSPGGIVYVYGVSFHWPGHTLAVGPGQALCEIGRPLTLDGVNLPQTLDEGEALDKALNAAFNGP